MPRAIFRTLMTGALLTILSGCSVFKVLNTLTPANGVHEVPDVAYGPEVRNRLDIYTPKANVEQAPVVVFFYGGSWTHGERANYAFVGRALAERGIVAVIADYRLYPEVTYPDFVEDSAKAVAWTRKHIKTYGGDPDRLFVMGHSAGAYNAAMLALDPRWLAREGVSNHIISGWIGLAGPYDFLPIKDPEIQRAFLFPNTPRDSQPINHINAGSPPALLLASNKDKEVDPKRNTGGLAMKLREAGLPVRELYFSRTTHGSLVGAFAKPLRSLAPVIDEVVMFVNGPHPTAVAASPVTAP